MGPRRDKTAFPWASLSHSIRAAPPAVAPHLAVRAVPLLIQNSKFKIPLPPWSAHFPREGEEEVEPPREREWLFVIGYLLLGKSPVAAAPKPVGLIPPRSADFSREGEEEIEPQSRKGRQGTRRKRRE